MWVRPDCVPSIGHSAVPCLNSPSTQTKNSTRLHNYLNSTPWKHSESKDVFYGDCNHPPPLVHFMRLSRWLFLENKALVSKKKSLPLNAGLIEPVFSAWNVSWNAGGFSLHDWKSCPTRNVPGEATLPSPVAFGGNCSSTHSFVALEILGLVG